MRTRLLRLVCVRRIEGQTTIGSEDFLETPAGEGVGQRGGANHMRGVDTLLSGFLRRIADDEELSLIFMRELWPQLVGEQLARRTRPRRLRGGKLTVAAFSRSWRRELAPLADAIVRAVNRRWNAELIDQIEFEFHPKQ